MPRSLTGIVSSDQRDKTITVTVTTRETHPIYKKQYTVTRKFSAHDANNSAHIGDRVLISEHRPFSKTKSWVLSKIIEKSKGKIELKAEAIEEVASTSSPKGETA